VSSKLSSNQDVCAVKDGSVSANRHDGRSKLRLR